MTIKKLISNCFIVVFVALVAFVAHLLINNLFIESITVNQLIYSYVVNVILACGVIILLFALRNKLKDQLGFIFMAASMLKFVFFFFLFFPQYKADGVLTRLEFLTFFIPYVICLITESVILSKFLNRLDNLKP